MIEIFMTMVGYFCLSWFEWVECCKYATIFKVLDMLRGINRELKTSSVEECIVSYLFGQGIQMVVQRVGRT